MAGDYLYRDDMNGPNGKDKYTDPIDVFIDWSQQDPKSNLGENAWNGEMDSELDYWFQSFLMGVPGINTALTSHWTMNDLKSYMNSHNLNWNDLISGHVLSKFGNSVGRTGVNFVGDMVKELYS